MNLLNQLLQIKHHQKSFSTSAMTFFDDILIKILTAAQKPLSNDLSYVVNSYNQRGEFLRFSFKLNSSSLNVLPKEKYLSPRATEILAAKYKSTISEMQRTLSFSKSLATKHDFATAKNLLLKAMTIWFENKINIENTSSLSLGQKLNPVLQGTKVHLTVTELTDLPGKIRFTFFNEDKSRLTWTTFALTEKWLDKKHARFSFVLQTVSDFTHERMSPRGMENRIILKHEFNRSFKSFVSEYNKLAGSGVS